MARFPSELDKLDRYQKAAADMMSGGESTRALHIGVHWGMSYRDFTDELAGAVLVFDRARLEERFQLRAYHDPRCDDEDLYGPNYVEAEEVVRRRHIKDLSRYLLAVIWLKPSEVYSDRRRLRKTHSRRKNVA